MSEETLFVGTKEGVVDLLAPPEKAAASFRVCIYLPVRPATEAQKSWLRGNGFRELATTSEDLRELVGKGMGHAKRDAARLVAG
jgi:hypothetical protein